MNVLQMLLSGTGRDAVDQLGKSFGLPQGSTEKVLDQLVPVLTRAIGNNAASSAGLAGLAGALSSGGHDQYLERPAALAEPAAIEDGNRILGHVLGSKDVSRQVAQRAAANTGVDAQVIKKLLPAVAAMTMGALSKKTAGGAKLEGLASLLDRDGDGDVMDDVLNIAKKLF